MSDKAKSSNPPQAPGDVPVSAFDQKTHLQRHWRKDSFRARFNAAGSMTLTGHPPLALISAIAEERKIQYQAGLILHSSSLLVLGDKGSRGERVLDTTPVFWELLRLAVLHGPEYLHELLGDPRKFEELIAGVHKELNAKIVDLSPQSGDGCVDVWAVYEAPAFGKVTIMDQVKLYTPDQSIDPGDVSRILEARGRDSKYSKAVLSTTGKIPPVIYKDVEHRGERVILRDARSLNELFKKILDRQSD